MKQTFKNVLFSLVTTLLFFSLVEAVCSVFFVRPGARDFIERRILEQGLTRWKSDDEIRIFFYGESTIQGDALYPRSTIDLWVKAYLDDLLKEGAPKRVRVFNFGRLGCNSRFILDSFEETLPYKPDLAVFYSVHNDFVQLDNRHTNFDQKPPRFGEKGFTSRAAREFVKRSAFLSEANRLKVRYKIERSKRRDALKRAELPMIERKEKTYNPEYDALDQRSPVFKTILRRWRQNVQKIVHIAEERRIPVIFLSGVSDFKSYHPNESVLSAALSKDELRAWDAAFRGAEASRLAGDAAAAARLYRRALRIDAEYAMAYYRLGQCEERLGRYRRANRCYLLANEKDRVPLRAPSEVREFYSALEALGLPDVTVARTQKLFEEHSRNGIVDGDLMLDTMHPTVDGQALMALAIVKSLYARSFLPAEWWNWNKLRSIEKLKEGFDLDDDFQFLVYLNKACYIGRFYDKAIEYSNKALELRPNSSEAKRSLAWAYWRRGDEEKAVDIYRELIESAPAELADVFKQNPDLTSAIAARGRRRAPYILTPG